MEISPNNSSYLNTHAAIEEYICNPKIGVYRFDTIASKIMEYQLANNIPYNKFCDHSNFDSACSWREFPAISTDAFKSSTSPSCLSSIERKIQFMTSGTTGEQRGSHYFRDAKIYELSILEAWKQLALPKPENLLILTPSPIEAPHSSLSHMMETLRRAYCPDAKYLIVKDQLDAQAVIEASKNGHAVTLLGTALSFLNLFEMLESPIELPSGSWAMETGGYKGSGRSLTKEQLYSKFDHFLGISSDNVWNEYSMTELSSQCYTRGLGQAHTSPPWMKIRVVHPESDTDVKPGEMGYLVIYDLANVDSVCAIRTQDLAIYHDEHRFTLIGRDPSALPRGCSRSMDDRLNT